MGFRSKWANVDVEIYHIIWSIMKYSAGMGHTVWRCNDANGSPWSDSGIITRMIVILKEKSSRRFSTSFKKDWLISDLIPKKSEKFEFLKNLVTMFFGVKN